MTKYIKLLIAALLPLLYLTSCGYHVGSISNPQIKTIAIAPIINETYNNGIADDVRQALSEKFMLDGSWKVKPQSEADCILYGRVTNITTSAENISIGNSGVVYITTQFNMTVSFEYTVIIPGRAQPVIPTTQVQATVQYEVPVDQYIAQQQAFTQAGWQIAGTVVANCTENW